ncbi:hypothetical protein ABH935_002958 [Catenulispora sp. GAS73]|uniref:hypothetical protein n=1 Tax=Catenulispora sp. GAS73 TaxID=3156269 RepID=UPI00351233A1
MKHGHVRRTAALALTAAATLGGALLTAGPASAIDRVGGIGCSTNGVTIYEGNTYDSLACYAGSAGTYNDTVGGVGGVKGVWNHGYTMYYVPTTGRDDFTSFLANDVRYPYDYYLSQNRSVTIEN